MDFDPAGQPSRGSNDADVARFLDAQADLYTAVVSDVLDALGRTEQMLPPQIRGLHRGAVVVGRAMPVVVSAVTGLPKKPFGLLTESLDQLQPGEIYVAGAGGTTAAAWGELLSATAAHRGAHGAVVDGYHRASHS